MQMVNPSQLLEGALGHSDIPNMVCFIVWLFESELLMRIDSQVFFVFPEATVSVIKPQIWQKGRYFSGYYGPISGVHSFTVNKNILHKVY